MRPIMNRRHFLTTATIGAAAASLAGTGWAQFPDATNSGVPAGTLLKKYTGPQAIQTTGTVLDGYDFPQSVVVAADNVTIRNSRIVYNDFFGVNQRSGANFRLERNTIVGPGNAGDSPAAVSCDV